MSFFSQLRIMNYSLVSRTLLIYAFVVLIGSVSSSHVCSSGNRPKPHACAAGVEACAPPHVGVLAAAKSVVRSDAQHERRDESVLLARSGCLGCRVKGEKVRCFVVNLENILAVQ